MMIFSHLEGEKGKLREEHKNKHSIDTNAITHALDPHTHKRDTRSKVNTRGYKGN